MNIGEYQVSKLTFTLDQLYSKYEELLDQYEELDGVRRQRVAALARNKFPHILDPNFKVARKPKQVCVCFAV